MGKINIIAKNFSENASGSIREDAAQIRNYSEKQIVQNGENGVNYDKNKDRKPPTDIRVTKVEGPFDANGKLVEKIALGTSYVFKAILTRKPTVTELKLLKWAIKLDNNEKEIVSGVAPLNKLDGEKIIISFKINNNFEKAKVYAFYQKADDGVSSAFKLKGMPKIIIVNGQWRLAKYSLGEYVGPTQPKKPYWATGFNKSAIEYFSLKNKYVNNKKIIEPFELEKQKFILYYDGSSYAGGDQSGSDRFNNGKKFAEENYKEIIEGLGNESIYLVSHSEGGAYASGIADYLYKKGHEIGEHVLLSPDEGDEFEINPAIPSYQLQYMFFSSIYNPLMADLKYFKFKKWGKYYAVVDWVTNEHTIKGVKKSGISIEQDAGWSGVHGWTNSTDVFKRITDLKNVKTFEAIGEYDKKVYSGKQQTEVTNKTLFYKIDNEYLIFNCPPIIKIK